MCGTEKPDVALSSLLSEPRSHVHLVGIGGVGMAALAFQLKARGFTVSGCDLAPGRTGQWLEARGIPVAAGHAAAHQDADIAWVVRSAAVPDDGPEIARVRQLGRPLFFRGQVLPELLKNRLSVAVAGTHGKTTTTTFITQVLHHAGRAPSWCIGGEPGPLGGVAGFCGSDRLPARLPAAAPGREILAVEADESDGTLALYAPDIAVITNIEFDHMEHFESVAAFEDCFRAFMRQARKRVVFCADDPRAAALCRALPHGLSYGFSPDAALRAVNVETETDRSAFSLELNGHLLGPVSLPVPGVHNVLNALAAAAVMFEFGLDFNALQAGLGAVSLPRRRFDIVARRNGITVISDYAHHPSEIAALLRTARRLEHRRLLAVFQPHRYTRTLALGKDFPPAFDGVAELVLAPVYAASEKPLPGGGLADLYACFRDRQAAGGATCRSVVQARSLEQAWHGLRRQLSPGDVLLVIGAGDVEKIAGWARQESEAGPGLGRAPDAKERWPAFAALRLSPQATVKLDEPLANKTTLKVGGAADIWVETGSLADVRTAQAWASEHRLPFRILGGGSNVLVSDLGLRGITLRLAGGDFSAITPSDSRVTAGAGVPLARLLGWMEDHSLAGLEFLEGIPGTVGGAVRMNAGAWGDETGKHIISIHCLNPDGTEYTVPTHSAGFSYRSCAALENRILIEATFAIQKSDAGAIRRKRDAAAQKRKWMSGWHCAGSVFRNPEGDFAGRLIEQAGLKGRRVGGAVVSTAHANVFVTEAGAQASDMLALMEIVRQEVLTRSGVDLRAEVVVLE